MKEEKFLCTLNPLMDRVDGSTTVGAQKAKRRGFTTEIIAEQHLIAKERLACLCLQQREGLGCWGSGSGFGPRRERTGTGCHKDTLRGLVPHSWESWGKRLGILERKGIFVPRPFLSPCGHRQWLYAQRWPPNLAKPVGVLLALDMTALYDPKAGNKPLATAKARASAWQQTEHCRWGPHPR